MAGENTRTEILSQPDVWLAAAAALQQQADQLRAFYREGRYDQIVYTGCGSTYFMALAAAALTQQLTHTPRAGCPPRKRGCIPPLSTRPASAPC